MSPDEIIGEINKTSNMEGVRQILTAAQGRLGLLETLDRIGRQPEGTVTTDDSILEMATALARSWYANASEEELKAIAWDFIRVNGDDKVRSYHASAWGATRLLKHDPGVDARTCKMIMMIGCRGCGAAIPKDDKAVWVRPRVSGGKGSWMYHPACFSKAFPNEVIHAT